MISVILLEPENAGNIGAIARVMKNFGFKDLVLINPKIDYMSDEACARSMHGKDILENARVLDGLKSIESFDMVVGTTALLGSDSNLIRSVITPDILSENLGFGNVGLLFGRESSGLSNEELRKCDIAMHIPSSPNYPTLNLSHAVSIVLYELSKNVFKREIKLPSAGEKAEVVRKAGEIVDNLSFSFQSKKETQLKLWEKIVSKGLLTRRETYVLLGFLKKISDKFKKQKKCNPHKDV